MHGFNDEVTTLTTANDIATGLQKSTHAFFIYFVNVAANLPPSPHPSQHTYTPFQQVLLGVHRFFFRVLAMKIIFIF